MNNPKNVLIALIVISLGLPSISFSAGLFFEKPVFKTGKITLNFSTPTLTTMTETPFVIVIYDETGKKINHATLNASLDMPAMPMPPNHPEVVWDINAYRGNAIFTMAGSWQMIVDINRPGYDTEQVSFDIEQVNMK